MTRAIAALCLLTACGGDKADSASQTTPPTTDSVDSGLSTTGTPSGTGSGTPGGTPTGTTTTGPATDYCPPWPAATGTVVTATTGDIVGLQTTIDGLASGDTLELAPGTWFVGTPLVLSTPGITVRSQSGNRADVIFDGMDQADAIFQVRASDISLVSLTLTNAFGDGVQAIPAGAPFTGLSLYDLAIVDNGQYGVSIDAELATNHADDGTIACSHIALTAAGRPDVRNGCRTAGVEALRASGWTVRDNLVEGFWCNSGNAHAGIRFWRGSRDTIVERNRVEDSRRGIVLGVGSDSIVRGYQDQPCGGILTQHYGGQVHNNLVWAGEAGLVASASGIEDGVTVESACEVQVLHNTVHLQAPVGGSIQHRHPNTSGVVANNLTRNTVRRLDGSLATSNSNVENAGDYTWVHVPSGDFHIAPGASAPIDAGDPQWLVPVPDDIDGHDRSPAPDAGWDERL